MLNRESQHILVTGAAGFIGHHLCERLLKDGYQVTGLDNLADEYTRLRMDRLAELGIDVSAESAEAWQSTRFPSYTFVQADIRDQVALERVFARGITHVIHLAALVGVRKSVRDPRPYLEVNVDGFFNVLDLSQRHGIEHLVFASSSSVYGLTDQSPFQVSQTADHPVSFYAATKKANELFAHSFSYLHKFPVTGLRFFTVYGPWGRPHMAPYLFTRNIVDGKPIQVFNHGKMRRDFTYVGDIVEGLMRVLPQPPQPLEANEPLETGRSHSPFRIYNIGHGAAIDIMEFIREIERLTGRKAEIVLADHQPGDVEETFADVSGLQKDFDYQPGTDLREGLQAYWEWFHKYYNL